MVGGGVCYAFCYPYSGACDFDLPVLSKMFIAKLTTLVRIPAKLSCSRPRWGSKTRVKFLSCLNTFTFPIAHAGAPLFSVFHGSGHGPADGGA